jgi:K+/H+ antiporter YhaU regulatory subunit KhtT
MGSATEQHKDFLLQQIEALQRENERLNEELKKVKENALKIRLTDPNFDKPLSELNVNYEIVTL